MFTYFLSILFIPVVVVFAYIIKYNNTGTGIINFNKIPPFALIVVVCDYL